MYKYILLFALVYSISAYADVTQNVVPVKSVLQQKKPNINYIYGQDFNDFFDPIPEGNVVADVTAVNYTSPTSGCFAADFANFPTGNIALVKRGGCLFATKFVNAQNAGASGIMIANNNPGLITGSLSGLVNNKLVGVIVSGTLGNQLYNSTLTDGVIVHINVVAGPLNTSSSLEAQ